MSQFVTSGDQRFGASASVPVLPMNIQNWFPLGLTDLSSLQSKGLSRIFSPEPQFESINSVALSFLYAPTLTSTHDYWKNYSFDSLSLFRCSVMSDSCDRMDCSLPGSSVHGILQARTLEWVAISFSRVSSWPRYWTRVFCIADRYFTNWAIREALIAL